MTIDELLNRHEIWKQFHAISQIPRGTGNEKQVQEFIKDKAQKMGYSCVMDNVYNLLVLPKSTKKDTILIQAHVDMVCEKNANTVHDFKTDPIKFVLKNEDNTDYLYAQDTTLGSDNGCGVAMMLAMIEDTKNNYDNIMYLFTVSEEGGDLGILKMNDEMKSHIKSAKYCINLDTFVDNKIMTGCSSMYSMNLKGSIEKEDAKYTNFYKIELKGLKGGHSGADAHRGFGNAIKFSARLYHKLSNLYKMQLVNVKGGDANNRKKYNAIPRESELHICTDESIDALKVEIDKFQSKANKELNDGLLTIAIEKSNQEKVLSPKSTDKIMHYLMLLPYGAINQRDYDGVNLTILSANLGTVIIEDSAFEIILSSRSNIQSYDEYIFTQIKDFIILKDDKLDIGLYVPVWEPKDESKADDSKLLKIARQVYKDTCKSYVAIPSHVWVEPGYLCELNPQMEIISIGCDIKNAHSPRECVSVVSAEMMVKRTHDIITKLNK